MVMMARDMEIKEGYKLTEVGVIPEDWVMTMLGEIVNKGRPICYGIVQTGKTVNNGVPCIRVIDLNDGKINKENLITTSKDISDSYKRTILKEGDLVIALRGKIGELAIIGQELTGANLTRGLALIAVNASLDPSFFLQQLSSSNSKAIFEKNLNGSALQEIPINVLKKIPVAYPRSKYEQKAIATALSDIDALITSLDKLIAKKRDIKQATMQQLLTGKTRLPKFSGELEPAYKQTEAGMIPDDWEVKKLRDVADFLDGRRKPVKESDRAKMRGEYPYYGASGVVDYVDDYIFDEELILLGEDGENILSRNCKLAFRVSGKIWVNNHAHVLKPKTNMDLSFLTEYLESLDYGQFNTGTAQPKLNKRVCSEIVVFLPSLLEQQAIATVLSDMDAEIAALEQKREKTRMMKQGMMQELLTGKIRLV